MSETVVVPYKRFVEVRQRRRQVAAELALRSGSLPNGDSHHGEPPPIDCEAVANLPKQEPLITSGI
jgi:hypothetical protein